VALMASGGRGVSGVQCGALWWKLGKGLPVKWRCPACCCWVLMRLSEHKGTEWVGLEAVYNTQPR